MSSREAIGLGLEALLPTIIDPNTSAALFGKVKLGHIFDPSAYSSFAEITHFQGKAGPMGSGGSLVGWRIEDQIVFQVGCGVPYDQDSRAATVASLRIQDIFLAFLFKYPKVPDPNDLSKAIGSVYSLLGDQQFDRSQPVTFPNGRVYLMWWSYAVVQQQYNVELVQQ